MAQSFWPERFFSSDFGAVMCYFPVNYFSALTKFLMKTVR